MKLTPWFPGDVKPVRKGLYQRKGAAGTARVSYSWWNGYAWLISASNPTFACDHDGFQSAWQCAQWRGLAEQPKEKQ